MKRILTNYVYSKHTCKFHCVLYDTWRGERANVEKPLLALFHIVFVCIRSLPEKFICYIHIIYCVCICVYFGSSVAAKFSNENEATGIYAWHGINVDGIFLVAEARTHAQSQRMLQNNLI